VFTLLGLLGGGVLAYVNVQRQIDSRDQVLRSHEVIGELETLLSAVKDTETGQRGYLLTAEPKYLEPFATAVGQVQSQLSVLIALLAGDPVQQARFAQLRPVIDGRLDELRRTVASAQEGEVDAALAIVRTDAGKALMDDVRVRIGVMQEAEQQALQQRLADVRQRTDISIFSIYATVTVGLVSVAAVFALVRRNVSERDRAAREVAGEREALRVTLASIGDAVITTDIDGRVQGMNAVAEGLTAWPLDAARGQRLETIFTIVSEATREVLASPVRRALREGTIVGLANHTVLIGRDGSERAIEDSAAPIRSAMGDIIGCVLVFHDVSERTKAEKHARELLAEAAAANAKFQALFEQGPLFAGVMRLDGVLLEANRPLLEGCGFTKEQAIGTPFWEGPWWSPSPALAERVKAATTYAASGRIFRDEMPYFVGDGSERVVELVVLPITDQNGRVVWLAPTGNDITERRQMQSELRQLASDLSDANARKDEFLATLAHELRNPLAPIRTGLEVMRRAKDDPATAELARLMMERQVGHMVRMVDDLLDVSRISRGLIELRKERVDLTSVLHHALETSRPLIDASRHELVTHLPAEPILVTVDPTRLGQVFANILNNAARYTDRGGRIEVRAGYEGADVVVRIRDNGEGIAAADLEKIFEVFTQVGRSADRSHAGLGIGLSLAGRLVGMHGGSIQAISAGHGHGSEFVVRLPAAEVAAADPAGPPARRDGPLRDKPHRILVADDNADAATALVTLLEMLGHDARMAGDGEEAFAVADAFRPEVILLDIGMPRANGYDVCRRIRAQEWGRTLLIVALTGWGQAGDKLQSERAGFDAHLVKPADIADIELLLRRVTQ
jgi:PAS domain S-box-containing protein